MPRDTAVRFRKQYCVEVKSSGSVRFVCRTLIYIEGREIHFVLYRSMDVYRCHEFIIKIFVILAQAGIQRAIELDPGLRRGDECRELFALKLRRESLDGAKVFPQGYQMQVH
jgi:hypothetical protein